MLKIQWWLRIVGVLYLLLGLVNVISGLDIGQHPETLTWLVLGGKGRSVVFAVDVDFVGPAGKEGDTGVKRSVLRYRPPPVA